MKTVGSVIIEQMEAIVFAHPQGVRSCQVSQTLGLADSRSIYGHMQHLLRRGTVVRRGLLWCPGDVSLRKIGRECIAHQCVDKVVESESRCVYHLSIHRAEVLMHAGAEAVPVFTDLAWPVVEHFIQLEMSKMPIAADLDDVRQTVRMNLIEADFITKFFDNDRPKTIAHFRSYISAAVYNRLLNVRRSLRRRSDPEVPTAAAWFESKSSRLDEELAASIRHTTEKLCVQLGSVVQLAFQPDWKEQTDIHSLCRVRHDVLSKDMCGSLTTFWRAHHTDLT